MAAKLFIAQREWTVLKRFVKPHQSTRWADGWVGFPFRFTECDLGHDGALRGPVGKRSTEYNTRSPFFLLPWGRPINKVTPMGTKIGRVPHWHWSSNKRHKKGGVWIVTLLKNYSWKLSLYSRVFLVYVSPTRLEYILINWFRPECSKDCLWAEWEIWC